VNLPSSWRRIGARWPYLPAGAQCRADVWLDQAIANRDRDQAHLENAKIDLNRYTELAKEHSIATQLAESQKAIVDQIVAMIKADEAIIESAGVNLSYTNLTSPIDGVTGIRQIDIGNIIHPTDVNGLVDVTQVEAAVEEGILPGGGVALLRATEVLKRVRASPKNKRKRRGFLRLIVVFRATLDSRRGGGFAGPPQLINATKRATDT
jgi:multidrug efflux pump subunit AcrA (membrane-fusion protein)